MAFLKPEEALRTVKNIDSDINILITHLIMPVMIGLDFLDKIMSLNPES